MKTAKNGKPQGRFVQLTQQSLNSSITQFKQHTQSEMVINKNKSAPKG